jgi:hypothetical protein
MLATIAQVVRNCSELQSNTMAGKIEDVIAEAEVVVLADLSGLKDVYKIQNYDPAPTTLNQLVIYKAREIGYRTYYSRVPEGTEVQYYQGEYNRLLLRVENMLSKIDNFSDEDNAGVVFI